MNPVTELRLDVSAAVCPAPLVRAREALRELPPGATLRVTLAADSVASVPRTLRDEGYEVLSVARSGDGYEVLFRAKGTRSGGDAGPSRACS